MVTLHSVFNLPGRHWRRKHTSWLGSRWLSLSRAAFFDQVHKLQKDGLRKAWIPFTLFLSWYVFQKHALDSAFFSFSCILGDFTLWASGPTCHQGSPRHKSSARLAWYSGKQGGGRQVSFLLLQGSYFWGLVLFVFTLVVHLNILGNF